ncbi:hypothetical protein MASR2M18_13410 [Ignavibacteria bacterium]|nr:DUF2723 domain-containing protein [Bacteroidota bacterium]MCZ2132288.1 DUF2723 domain-containing protein [Bacteroidota bacterium]
MKFLDKPIVAPIIAFIATLAVYCITLAPDVTFTDAGELAGVAATLGIAHPTGYPLFTLLSHIWTLLPIPGSVIFRLNLFSAVCAAASAGVFVALARNFLRLLNPAAHPSVFAVLASALLYGFSITIWEQSCSIEVYSLQLLLFTVILLVFLKAIGGGEESRSALIVWAFLLGLGFTNHGSTILLAPASIYLFFIRPNSKKNNYKSHFRTISFLILPFLLGLSVWLYLPIRAAADPIFNWGGVQRGFDKFWYHASGKQFQVWMFQAKAISGNFNHFLSLFPREFGWAGIIALFFGITAVWRSSRRLFWGLLLLVLSCLAYSLSYEIHDIDAYFSLAIIALMLFTAAGMHSLSLRQIRFILPALFIPAALAMTLNFKAVNQHSNYLVPEYTRILTENLEPNAVILSHLWDFWCSAFWYKQQAEGYRKDITLVETELLRRTWYPDKVESWYPYTLAECSPQKQVFLEELRKFEADESYSPTIIQERYEQLLNAYIDSNYSRHPIYVTADVISGEPAVAVNYLKIPQGFAWRLVKPGDSLPNPLPTAYGINIARFASSLPGSDGYLETKIRDLAMSNLLALADFNERGGNISAANDAREKASVIGAGLPRIRRKR